jgi:2-methylisocitrate lyase-like PEP mutase family enzyme
MNNTPSVSDVSARAEALRGLHGGPGMLVLPNAWDAASARVFEAAGFPAIATTSAGVARALGYEDHQGAPMAEMLAAAARITRAVSVPVTVDFEAGYGRSPREIAERLVEAGAAGFNFEDTDHGGDAPMVDDERQAERIAALKEAGHAAGVDLVLNARVDVFIHRRDTPPADNAGDGLRRAALYRQAGADCVYPILLSDEAVIAQFVEAVGAINVNLRPGGMLTLQRAASLGVRRISYAGSLFSHALKALEDVTNELRAEMSALDGNT